MANPQSIPGRPALRGMDDNTLYREYDRAKAMVHGAARLLEAKRASAVVARVADELTRRKLTH